MQFGLYAVSLLAGAFVSAAVGFVGWRGASNRAGRLLALLMAAVFVWSLTAGLEAAALDPAVKILLSKFEYLGITSVPVLMFMSSLWFVRGGRRPRRGWLAALWLIPFLTVLAAFTNGHHHFLWTSFTPVTEGAERLLIYGHGPLFWVFAVYAYLLLTIAALSLLSSAVRLKGLYRLQALAVLVSILPPSLANFLYLAGRAAAPTGHDFTPVGFAASGLLLLWAMFRLRLVDLVPVARDRVIESMGESLFILDDAGRLAATNPAARRLIAAAGGPAENVPERRLLGNPAAGLVPRWPALAASLAAPAAEERELAFPGDGPEQTYSLRLSPIFGQGTLVTGWVAVLYDISRVKSAEKAAVEARAVAEALREAGATLSSKLDFNQISALILELLKRVIPYDIGAFMTVEDSALKLAAIRRPADHRNLIGETYPLSGSRLCNMAAQRLRPLIGVINGPDDILLPLGPDAEAHSFLGVPVVIRDQVIGLIALYNTGRRPFNEENAAVAEAFAGQVAIAMDNSRRVELMERQAITDELTGLYNRRAFALAGDKEVSRARRYGRPLALIFFDIDHFKNVNDSHGHLIGDHVLRVLTELVTRTTRATDIVCRYGGEEFIVLMPEADRDEALAMAERLRLEISRMTVVTAGGTLSLTVSLGVAALRRNEDESLEDLIARADRAMYQAKAAGRNTVRG
ncbi:MAG TPA: diguanylate cyclase [Candidatus Aminicenantes bacterium]|nr:diguanylate cyclase [Candidatus Aminicenantes bacterium]HRY64926.1 diguanylate cyclase [Candidatus Aminicenantes bacterium]HRZ71839.1 diguanylate cyclase [Candidatus Aminicenantes bacterium]